MFDLARAYYFSLMFFTALSLNRSPLYTSVSLKVSSSVRNWPSLTCSVLKLRQCKQHCVRALRLQKVGGWNDNLSLLIRWVRHKRIDQAATPNLLPGSEEPGSRLPPQSPHWQNPRTLNDTTLKCLDSHSGWTADAILYIVRSLHHQVFLENLHALRLLATSHVHHRRFTLPAVSKRSMLSRSEQKANDTEFISIRWAEDGLSERSRVLSRRLLCFLSVMSKKLHILNGCMFFFFKFFW